MSANELERKVVGVLVDVVLSTGLRTRRLNSSDSLESNLSC